MLADIVEFTADDAALALVDMIDAATGDVPYVSQQQMAADMDRIGRDLRRRVVSMIGVHGMASIGDADRGAQRGADAFLREFARFEADPDAYADSLDPDVPATVAVAATLPATTVAATVPIAAMPVEALVVAPQAAPPAETAHPALTYVPRTMKGLFPGVSADYATQMVPTPRWPSTRPHVATPDPHYAFDGFTVKTMAAAMRRRRNVIAVGDPGCGKTEFFRQYAARIGMPYAGITFDGQLSRAEIIGSFRQVATPTGSATPFVDGLIPTLIQRPGILCLNEIDQCDPDIQYMLHDVYEGGGLTIQEDGGRFVPRHPDCHVVATANTKGRGSDSGLTHARHEMSEATRDRYSIWLNFTYLPADREAAVLVAKTSIAPSLAAMLVSIGNSIRQAYRNGGVSQPCSLRQLLDVAEFAEDFCDGTVERALAIACDLVLAGRANPEDELQIREFVKLKTAIDLTTLVR